MEDRLQPMGIDLALLPVNGRAPERRVAGNLDGIEAARSPGRSDTISAAPDP